jgi:hypothetical protein
MKFKKSILSVVLGLSAVGVFSGQALAAPVVDISNLNSGSAITTDFSQGISNSFNFSPSNTFSDNYLFNVGNSLVDFTATTGKLLGVKNLTLSLWRKYCRLDKYS